MKLATAGQKGLKLLVGGVRVEGVAPSGCWCASMALEGTMSKKRALRPIRKVREIR